MKQPAKALIARFGNLRGILDAPPEELRKVVGIGAVAQRTVGSVSRLLRKDMQEALTRQAGAPAVFLEVDRRGPSVNNLRLTPPVLRYGLETASGRSLLFLESP